MDAWMEGSIDPSVRKLIYQNAFYNHVHHQQIRAKSKLPLKPATQWSPQTLTPIRYFAPLKLWPYGTI